MAPPDVTAKLQEIRAEVKHAESTGEWDAARRALARALDIAPADPDLHKRMSWLATKSTELDEAERTRLTTHHWEISMKLRSRSASLPQERPGTTPTPTPEMELHVLPPTAGREPEEDDEA